MLVTDILREVVEDINTSIEFHTTEITGEGYKCYTTNTKWLSKKDKVTFDSVEYTVLDFSFNEWVLFSGASSIAVGTYNVNTPTFTHGKLKAVNAEIAGKKKKTDILPLIWNFELQPRTLPSNLDTVFQGQGTVRLFIMNSMDLKQFTTESDYTQTIKPLTNLVNSFLLALKRHKRVGKFYVARNTNHSKFTTGGTLSGSSDNWVLGHELSGIELEIELPIKKDLNCPIKVYPEGGAFDSGFSSGFDIT